ncbi:hypothetical protein [Nocardia salmonicida]|uniref:hypothetical protein n=1 Tax=Nocardia salmonicida TaxID=53431 RepID=UPI001FE1813A|nr:hypothetical protein [Nocardia salmonicida]
MTAAMNLRRRREPDAPAGVVAPPESLRAKIWERPVPGVGRAPLVWMLGVHGGAGATTLAHVLAPAADARGRWPGVFDRESPMSCWSPGKPSPDSPARTICCASTTPGSRAPHWFSA